MSDDHVSSDSPDLKFAALDTNVIPLGERALRGILDHVTAVGDEAETTYLEVKSSVELSSKAGVAKVAKFLLGAANRRPHEAARHFDGYALLVIGAQKNSSPGVPRGVEAHEVEDRLRPYLGPEFPAFEFRRIGVDAENEVLFVIAQPPKNGQSIFPCHKSFQGDDRATASRTARSTCEAPATRGLLAPVRSWPWSSGHAAAAGLRSSLRWRSSAPSAESIAWKKS